MIVTPTRTLLVVPELLMGNRVLRMFDGSGYGALRVQFRDDDGTKLRVNNAGNFLIDTTVHNTLLHGVYISGIDFLGFILYRLTQLFISVKQEIFLFKCFLLCFSCRSSLRLSSVFKFADER